MLSSATSSIAIIPSNCRNTIEWIPLDKHHSKYTVTDILNEADDLIHKNVINTGVYGVGPALKIADLEFVLRRQREFHEVAQKKGWRSLLDVPLSKLLRFEPHIQYTLNMKPAVTKEDRHTLEELYRQVWDREFLAPLRQELEQSRRELTKLRPTSFLEELQERDKLLEQELKRREGVWANEMAERTRRFEDEIRYRDRLINQMRQSQAQELGEHARAEEVIQRPAPAMRASSSSQMRSRAAPVVIEAKEGLNVAAVAQPSQPVAAAHKLLQQEPQMVVVEETKKPQQRAAGLDRSFQRQGVATRDSEQLRELSGSERLSTAPAGAATRDSEQLRELSGSERLSATAAGVTAKERLLSSSGSEGPHLREFTPSEKTDAELVVHPELERTFLETWHEQHGHGIGARPRGGEMVRERHVGELHHKAYRIPIEGEYFLPEQEREMRERAEQYWKEELQHQRITGGERWDGQQRPQAKVLSQEGGALHHGRLEGRGQQFAGGTKMRLEGREQQHFSGGTKVHFEGEQQPRQATVLGQESRAYRPERLEGREQQHFSGGTKVHFEGEQQPRQATMLSQEGGALRHERLEGREQQQFIGRAQEHWEGGMQPLTDTTEKRWEGRLPQEATMLAQESGARHLQRSGAAQQAQYVGSATQGRRITIPRMAV